MSTNAGGGGVRFPGSTETLPVPYDQSTDPAFSPPDPGGRPSLANRREKRNPPEETVDPLWEVGGIMVYLYDTIVWIHLWVTYLLEKLLARFVYVIDRALVDRDHPRQVGRIERFTYRVVAALVVGAFYGALVLAVVLYG